MLTFKQRERQNRLRQRMADDARVPAERRYDIVYDFGGERHTMRDIIPSDLFRAHEALKGQGAELVKTYFHGWGDYAPQEA